jgi:PAS domain S-box-containing protein
MTSKTLDVRQWIKEHLPEIIPMAVAVIDRDYQVVYANQGFEKMFGPWQGKTCHAVYKNKNTRCHSCSSKEAFEDGKERINEEVGYGRTGQSTRYLKHTYPICDADGVVTHLVQMSADVTVAKKILRENQLLFDQVPCNILVIDRNYRIVRANQRAKGIMGDLKGRYCYEGLKGFDHKCGECTARQTFADGRMHTGHHVWKSRSGEVVHQHVITVPLKAENGEFDTVMEMAVDITRTIKLQEGLEFAHTFLETLVTTSIDGIFAFDNEGEALLINPAAEKLFGFEENAHLTQDELSGQLPQGWLEPMAEGRTLYLPDTEITRKDGTRIPVRLVGNQLVAGNKVMGMAFSVQDLRRLKEMEKGKLEAERLAAVGQTVAGLAHGVKNLITALEGGMYMLNTGMSKGNIERIQKGLEMQVRNIERISVFVKAFLGFSRGREIRVKISQPADIAQEVVDLYSAKAQQKGIGLTNRVEGTIAPAPIDYESMHECLTNLVGNAIDACSMSDNEEGCRVTVVTREVDDTIIFEVIDNGCGMDYEVKQKVFTTFFTTKGLGGTGLGLLMTKKIVQEHGGTIELTSEPGQGTTFRILLPRRRLPKTVEQEKSEP